MWLTSGTAMHSERAFPSEQQLRKVNPQRPRSRIAIGDIHGDRVWYDPSHLGQHGRIGDIGRTVDKVTYDSLTVRERECLRLARDLPTKEIARALQLAPNTVDTYIRRATEKLGTNRRQAARLVAEFEACPQGMVSQFSRLSDTGGTADQEGTDRLLPSVRQPDAVREERVSFDFDIAQDQHVQADFEARQGGTKYVPAAFWVMAIAALIMLLIIGSVPMADSMGKIGSLIYSKH